MDRVKLDKQCFLAFTHSDYDHIIGYQAFEGFTTIATQNFVNQPNKKALIDQINDFDDNNYIKRSYPISYPSVNIVVMNDPHDLNLGQDQYRFYQATGHNSDGMLIYNVTRDFLIVGDYMSNIEFPYVYHSFAEYSNTLDKIESIVKSCPSLCLIVGHGDHTQDRIEINQRLLISRNYMRSLRKAVIDRTEFDIKGLLQTYDFPKIMTQFHEANVLLLKKELDPDL